MQTTIEILEPRDWTGLDQTVRIYQEAIEPSEQKSPVELARLSADPRYVFLVAREEREVTGFAIQFFPAEGSFWLLEYMAVDPGRRSRGLGEAIFRAAGRVAQHRDPASICLLEVDQPGTNASAGNFPEKRLAFYRRMGCRAVSGLSYVLPLDKQGAAPPPMILLVHGDAAGDSIAKARLRTWLAIIYAEVYGRPPDDPRIDAMTSSLPDTIPLTSF